MHLEILRHDGPARLGKIHFEETVIPTPSILWSPRAGRSPAACLEISSEGGKIGGKSIRSYGTIFAQEKISEFGILPTFPSGYDVPREIASEAVEKTIGFLETYPGFGAVVEGGRYVELRKRSLEHLKDRPILKIANPERLIRNHRKLVEVVTAARETASPNTAIYMSDIPPHLFPLLVYMGVDLFDLKRAILGGHEGLYLTPRGVMEVEGLFELPCPCAICVSRVPGDLDSEALRSHNINVTTASIRGVRGAIRSGSLRNLVEEGAACDLNAMGALRILDSERGEFLERYTPVSAGVSNQRRR